MKNQIGFGATLVQAGIKMILLILMLISLMYFLVGIISGSEQTVLAQVAKLGGFAIWWLILDAGLDILGRMTKVATVPSWYLSIVGRVGAGYIVVMSIVVVAALAFVGIRAGAWFWLMEWLLKFSVPMGIAMAVQAKKLGPRAEKAREAGGEAWADAVLSWGQQILVIWFLLV